jgi:hypothetical protein
MLKKVIVGTLFIGFVGILVIGAVVRTMDKSQDTANSAGNGHGRSDSSVAVVPANQRQDTANSTGNGRGRNDSSVATIPLNEGEAEVQAEVAEWLTLTGVVEQIDESALIIGLAPDESITVEGRPWRFAREQGFAAAVGDKVILTGFYDGDVFEVGQLTNVTKDQVLTIREETGRPLWAGGGGHSATVNEARS